MPTETTGVRAKYKNPHRVSRSITFLKDGYEHLEKRATAENRSVNWIVNDLVAQDVGHRAKRKTRRA